MIFAADGTLVASVAQEGLVRERRQAGERTLESQALKRSSIPTARESL